MGTQHSYITGLGENPPTHPQHRLASCPTNGSPCSVDTDLRSLLPNPNILTGEPLARYVATITSSVACIHVKRKVRRSVVVGISPTGDSMDDGAGGHLRLDNSEQCCARLLLICGL